jgi:hypothetical protein
MEIVARHLQNEAQSRSGGAERDEFGRSSFNRYYYATFLLVRSGLAKLRHEWSEIQHAAIPELLRGKVTEELKRGRSRAQRASDSELVTQCNRSIAAAAALAQIMDEGRMTRVTADYEPDVPVDFTTGSDFRLNTVPVSKARNWPSRAKPMLDSIASTWRQIHGGH